MNAITKAPGRYFIESISKFGKINAGKPFGTSPIKSKSYFSKSNKYDKIPVTKT